MCGPRLPGSCRASFAFVVLVSSPLVGALRYCDVESRPDHSRGLSRATSTPKPCDYISSRMESACLSLRPKNATLSPYN
jgi:hypothetical protein